MLSDSISSFNSTFTINRLTEEQYQSALSSGYIDLDYNNFQFYLTEEDSTDIQSQLNPQPINSITWWQEYSDPPKRRYMVIFDSIGGKSQFKFKSVKEGSEIGYLPISEKEGYEFLGWICESGYYAYESMLVNSNITLSAKYKEVI